MTPMIRPLLAGGAAALLFRFAGPFYAANSCFFYPVMLIQSSIFRIESAGFGPAIWWLIPLDQTYAYCCSTYVSVFDCVVEFSFVHVPILKRRSQTYVFHFRVLLFHGSLAIIGLK